jgi:hypothetical protein
MIFSNKLDLFLATITLSYLRQLKNDKIGAIEPIHLNFFGVITPKKFYKIWPRRKLSTPMSKVT